MEKAALQLGTYLVLKLSFFNLVHFAWFLKQLRFIAGRFVDWYEPTVEDSYRKIIDFMDDTPSIIDIFDTVCRFHY